MSAGEARAEAARYSFAPTKEDAAVAAARAGLRSALRGRLSLHHAAPLAAFALILTFLAILAFTGLIGRRLAEVLLILAAARRAWEAESELRAGKWPGWDIDQFLGRDVHGAVVGVVGFGCSA